MYALTTCKKAIAATAAVLLVGLVLYQYFRIQYLEHMAVAAERQRPSFVIPQKVRDLSPRPISEVYSPELTAQECSIVRKFHELIYPRTVSTNWLGIPTLQNPFDMWMQQEIITEIKPDFVVECGTHKGGSALIWSMLLGELNPEGRVITIDIVDYTADAAKLAPWKRVDFILGSSTDPRIVKEVTQRTLGKKVVVILDSDHSRDHVLAELHAYAPLVPMNSYLIVQDTDINIIVRPDHGPGPMHALDAFMKVNDQFVSDRDRERLLFTNHPRGYLKRIKPAPG